MAKSGWETQLVKEVGRRIGYYRREQKVTAESLAAACTALGLPMARPVLAKLETGFREMLTVAELLVIAEALQVPPATLLFGHGLDDAVEALPGQKMTPWKAIRWFAGNSVKWESTITKTAVRAPGRGAPDPKRPASRSRRSTPVAAPHITGSIAGSGAPAYLQVTGPRMGDG